MPDELTLRFERETKNTIRYQELAEGSEYAVGFLYVRKAELARLGDPDGNRARRGRGCYRYRCRLSYSQRTHRRRSAKLE